MVLAERAARLIVMRLFSSEKRLFEGRRGGWPVQVFEKNERRELRFGNHIVQSAYTPSAPDVLALEYVRAMLAGVLFMPDPEQVLHLGLGGGSLARFLHDHWPNLRQRVVEINPDVIEASFRFFDLPVSRRLRVTEADAVAFLAENRDPCDMVFLDAFIPDGPAEGLEEAGLYDTLRRKLAGKGWLVNNVWGSDRERLSRTIARMAVCFPTLYSVSVRAHSNVILIGGTPAQPPTLSQLTGRAAALSASVPFDFARWVGRLRPVGTAQRPPGEAWIARA